MLHQLTSTKVEILDEMLFFSLLFSYFIIEIFCTLPYFKRYAHLRNETFNQFNMLQEDDWDDKTYGYQNTNLGDKPWLVHILSFSANHSWLGEKSDHWLGPYWYKCHGALIAADVVVCGTSCFHKKLPKQLDAYVVVAGYVQRPKNRSLRLRRSQYRCLTKIDSFNSHSSEQFSILRLCSPFDMSFYINTIPMYTEVLTPGTHCQYSGFSIERMNKQNLKTFNTQTMPASECSKDFNWEDDNYICVRMTPCCDDGSLLVCTDDYQNSTLDTHWELVGIKSTQTMLTVHDKEKFAFFFKLPSQDLTRLSPAFD